MLYQLVFNVRWCNTVYITNIRSQVCMCALITNHINKHRTEHNYNAFMISYRYFRVVGRGIRWTFSQMVHTARMGRWRESRAWTWCLSENHKRNQPYEHTYNI